MDFSYWFIVEGTDSVLTGYSENLMSVCLSFKYKQVISWNSHKSLLQMVYAAVETYLRESYSVLNTSGRVVIG